MDLHLHQSLMKIRELLKQWSIFVYTGSALDDVVLMEIELDDLYLEKHVEEKEYLEMKMALRRAYRELGGE
jgi:uncharacterized protein YqgQ